MRAAMAFIKNALGDLIATSLFFAAITAAQALEQLK